MKQVWHGCEVSKHQRIFTVKLKQGCEIKKKGAQRQKKGYAGIKDGVRKVKIGLVASLNPTYYYFLRDQKS